MSVFLSPFCCPLLRSCQQQVIKNASPNQGSVIEKRERGEWGGKKDETGATIYCNLLHPSKTLNAGRNIPFQLSRVLVESKSPTWQKSDLRMTRVKDTDKGELLIFKELSWQTVRIEAKSTKNEDLTPLRLITNQSR